MKARKSLVITSFKLERRKDKKSGQVKKENSPILVDFKFDGQRVIYPIGYRIDDNKWSNETQRVKPNNFNKDLISASIINRRINRIEDKLPKIYADAIKLEIDITSKYLINELNDYLSTEENIQKKVVVPSPNLLSNVNDILQLFIDTECELNKWTEGTKKKFITFKRHLTDYNPNLTFNDITDEFLRKYIDHLRKNLNFNNSTNAKFLKMFKWFLNWATKKDYNKNLSYKSFDYKFKGTTTGDYQKNIVFLTWEELQHFYNLKLSFNKILEETRDIYCFCCFTSLRYSDIENLKKSDIKRDNNDNYYIELITVKTDEKLNIELNKYALAIWNKYKDVKLKDNKAFPVISNQKYNKNLKEVALLAEFKDKETVITYSGNKRTVNTYEKWELITTHTARKTFIINALYLGIQPDIIRSWTGHKDHKTMEQYIKIVNEQKRLSMNKFNEI